MKLHSRSSRFQRRILALSCLTLSISGMALSYSANTWATPWVPSDHGAVLRYETGHEDSQRSLERVDLEAELAWEIEELFDLTLSGRGRYDFESLIDRDSKESASVRNAYLSFDVGDTSWQLGKQQVAWGVMDGLRLLDQVSPLDFHEFNLPSERDRRQHQWMLNVQGDVEDSSWQWLWSPVPKVHLLPDSDDLFSFQAPRLRYGAEVGSPTPEIVDRSSDDHLFAARWTTFFTNFEFTGAAIYGPDHEPTGHIQINGSQRRLIRTYEERTLVGASFSANVDDLILRSELVYSPDKSLNTRSTSSLSVQKYQHSKVAMAVEFNAPLGLLINFQYLVDHVHDADTDLVRPETDHLYTLTLKRDYLNQTLDSELKFITSDKQDGQVRLQTNYELNDSVVLALGADLFFGDEDTLFGQYDNRDRLLAGITVHL